MARPLRAVYANSTYSDGVREMSDAELNDLAAPIILSYIVNNSSTTYGSTLRVNDAGAYGVSRGSALDVRSNTAIGGHPATNTTVTTYTFYQTERAQTFSLTSRPVHYVDNGGVLSIKEMTDQELIDDFIPSIVQTMITGGQGGYYLGPTSSGAPLTGTWVSVGTLNDTYYDAGGIATVPHTLWQRTTGTAQGTTRPLKAVVSGTETRLVEMTNEDIEALAIVVGEYIRTKGIGVYAIQPSAPGTGTWVSRGSFTDNINTLSDQSYSGAFVGVFGALFTGAYSRTFTGAYAGSYVNAFSGLYASPTAYSGTYTGVYSGVFTGAFTSAYVNTFTGIYASPVAYTHAYTGAYTSQYAGAYTGVYGGSYTGAYTGAYSGTFTGEYTNQFTSTYVNPYTGATFASNFTGSFVGAYQGSAPGNYAGSYTGLYNSSFVSPYTGVTYSGYYTGLYTGYYTGGAGIYSGSYGGTYSGSYAGSYTGLYNSSFAGAFTKAFTGNFTGAYTGAFSSAYASTFTQAFTGGYVQSFTPNFTGAYTGAFSGTYAGSYTGAFTGGYVQGFTGTFTGAYTGLTVINTTSPTTYTLWVRTA